MPKVTVYIRDDVYRELVSMAERLGYTSRRGIKYVGWMRLMNDILEEWLARKKMVLDSVNY